MSWSKKFDDPISIDGGKKLATLKDAALYIQALTKREQNLPHWQLAIETLINTAEGRDLIFHANIAMLKALHHDKPAPPTAPRRKAVKRFNVIR